MTRTPTRTFERWTTAQVELSCKTCSKMFYMHPASVKRGEGLYCSDNCKRGVEERSCKNCGKSFKIGRAELAKGNGAGTYCSRECYRATPIPAVERFWSKVNKTDTCWLWTGANSGGKWPYGVLGKGKRGDGHYTTHHFSWELHNGPVPEGLWVLHKCDVTLCVNPDHLFLGTEADNSADMALKGRSGGFAQKLSHEQALEVRRLHATGNYTQKYIAKAYGVSYALINGIITKRLRRYIK